MTTGTVSGRYAKALLRYVQETGGGERVYAQVTALLKEPESGTGQLEPELQRFVSLLVQNGRISEVRPVFRSFIEMYLDSVGVKLATIETATEIPGLEDRLRPMLEEHFGCRVQTETVVNPALIGGFTVEVGDSQLDASLKRRIDDLRRQFVTKINRIV